jgi:hypothetical protein
MRTIRWMQIAAIASSFALAGTAMAADRGESAYQPHDNGARMGAHSDANGMRDSEHMDNSKRADFDAWMHDYSAKHDGRITRQEYLDQMGDRWDRLDAQHRGYMSPDEARGIYYGQGMKGQ